MWIGEARSSERAGILPVVERETGRDVAPDRHDMTEPGCRRRGDLDTRAIGKGSSEKRMLATDALGTRGGDLTGQPGKDRLGERGTGQCFDIPAQGLDPYFLGAVDVDVGDV